MEMSLFPLLPLGEPNCYALLSVEQDGQMDGQMDGLTDGQTEENNYIEVESRKWWLTDGGIL